MIWRCPRCRGELKAVDARLSCLACASGYETVSGIPDLRIPGDAWIDFDDDLALARDLATRLRLPLKEFVRHVYAVRPGWDEARIDLRTRQVLEAPHRLRSEIRGWLAETLPHDGLFLDLGCGAGMLLAAAAAEGRRGVGIDVSMTWLVVAQRLVLEFGGEPILAAALGEALPLGDAAIGAVVSLDVIEHVRDPDQYLREIDRVTKPGGRIALSTPNRFSLTAEPHVFVWGVGWLPRPWQKSFVRWRSGRTYDDTVLMSSFGLGRRMRTETRFRSRIVIPPVSEEAIAVFTPLKARLARIYNRIISFRPIRPVFLIIGPFFRVMGVKP